MVLGFRIAGALAAACAMFACGGGGGDTALPLMPAPVAPAPIPLGPHVTFQRADLVIGQSGFDGVDPNRNGTANESTLSAPQGAAMAADGRLFIADTVNARVLVYPALPQSSGGPAAGVLGQPDFETTPFPDGASRDRFGPSHVALGAGKMAIADFWNSRVLIYSAVPSGNGALLAEPDVVLGQPDFESEMRRCGEAGMNYPVASFITRDGKLIVADTANSRVLIWLSVPTRLDVPPDRVLGQEDLLSCGEDHGDGSERDLAARTFAPSGVWSDDRRLVVATLRGVLVWSDFPSRDFQPADLVLGRDGFASLDLPLESGRSVGEPRGVSSDGVGLAVADAANHRVLIWNSFPTASGARPDVVLGASNLTGGAPGDSAETDRSMRTPFGVVMEPTRTLVMDTGNNRVLVFRRPPAQ